MLYSLIAYKKYVAAVLLSFITLPFFAQVSTCEELGLRPITPDGKDILKIYYEGNGAGVGGHGCWVHHHPNGKDYVITPYSWTRQPNDSRQTLIKNAMQALTDARREYVNYGTLRNQMYYILNDVKYDGLDGETFWLVADKCIMRSGVPNMRNRSNEYKRFVYAHEVGHCFVMENVPDLKNQYSSLNNWFDESVSEFLASEVYKQLNKEFEWARVFDLDGQSYRQPYAAYVLWHYYAVKKGKPSVVALMNALAETPNLDDRLEYLRNITFDKFFHRFLFDFINHKIPDSGNGDAIPRENIQSPVIVLNPAQQSLELPDIGWGRGNFFKLIIPSGYDLSITPPRGSNLKVFSSLIAKSKGINIEDWKDMVKIEGGGCAETPVWIMVSHLHSQPISNLSIKYSLYSNAKNQGDFNKDNCAALTAKTNIAANPEKVNDVFHFDYKIKSNIEIKKDGKARKLDNISYYVNTQDGSIFFPKESITRMAGGAVSNDAGRVDGSIWLSNHQMVTYLYDAIYKKKRAFTVTSKKTSDDVFMNEHLGFLQFFNNQADSLNISKAPALLPASSQWRGQSHVYAGKIVNADSEADMTLYIDCNPSPIATGFPMVGFLVGVVKDHRIKKCNQLIVFNKIETGDDYIQAELLEITKESKTFNATDYKPGGLLEGLTKGAGTNMQNVKANMAKFQQKAMALGKLIQDLKKEKRHCRETIKGDPTPCNKKYDPLIKEAKKQSEQLQYDMLKSIGAEDMMNKN